MNTFAKVFFTNALILVFGYIGLTVMDGMAKDEQASYTARKNAYDVRIKQAATEMVQKQFVEIRQDFKRCTGAHAPFLTDSVLIIGSAPGSNKDYYSGVIYVVTMNEAFAQPAGSIDVLGYCE